MKLEKALRLFFIALVAFAVILVVTPVVYADNGHGHDHGSGDVDVGVDVASSITGGDVSLSGGDTSFSSKDRAYAFSHGMGDVDINQCMGSTQWSTILVSSQKLAPNLWCMGESYDARGLYKMAARMRCKIDIIREDFETVEDCIDENTITPQPVAQPASIPEEDEEVHEELERSYAMLQSQISDLQALVEKSQNQKPVVRREVIQEQRPLLTAEQRSALMEVKK